MRFPWLQVDADVIEAKAGDLSVLLGLSRRETIGLLVDLWAWVLTRSPKDAPPDGIVRDSRTGTGAVPLLERSALWTGPEGKLAASLEEVGLLERITDGVRFRGIGRYRATWEKNRRRSKTAAEPDRNRTGTGGDSARKTQTQTQKEATSSAPAHAVSDSVDELPDATDDAHPVTERMAEALGRLPPAEPGDFALEVQSAGKREPKPSAAQRLYAALEASREGRCREAGLPFIAQGWDARRINATLSEAAKVRKGEAVNAEGLTESQQRFQDAWGEYLADEDGATREPPWSIAWFMSGGVRARYETRAIRAQQGAA